MAAPCDCCAVARQVPGHPVYTPACLWCGARLFQALGSLVPFVGAAAVKRRRTAVLDDWERHGHSRAALRSMALAQDVPLAPLPGAVEASAKPEPRRAPRRKG